MKTRPGLTLLELILALSLSAVVIALIAWGIDVHVRALDQRRGYAEDAQPANAILSRIADDLRNVATRTPIDLSGVEQLMSGADAESILEGVTGGDGETGGLAGESGGGEEFTDVEDLLSESETNENTTDIADSDTVPSEPGLYGNQYELQIDVSRLPRIDEYQATVPMTPGMLQDIPSEVKTVAYYVRSDTTMSVGVSPTIGATNTNGEPGLGPPTTGLVRRSLSRAVTEWASQNAAGLSLQQSEKIWAPEVLSLEFHYFDGTDWVYEWDSGEQGLPIAVEIYLTLRPRNQQVSSPFGNRVPATAQMPRIYRLVVRLPQAQLEATDESSELEALGL